MGTWILKNIQTAHIMPYFIDCNNHASQQVKCLKIEIRLACVRTRWPNSRTYIRSCTYRQRVSGRNKELKHLIYCEIMNLEIYFNSNARSECDGQFKWDENKRKNTSKRNKIASGVVLALRVCSLNWLSAGPNLLRELRKSFVFAVVPAKHYKFIIPRN